MKRGYFHSLTFDYPVLDDCKQYLNSRSCYFDGVFFSRKVCVVKRGIGMSERHLADIEGK